MISTFTQDTYKLFYKTNKVRMGVYYLRCKTDGKIYIGNSKNYWQKNKTGINNCCLGKQNSAKGFKWSY